MFAGVTVFAGVIVLTRLCFLLLTRRGSSVSSLSLTSVLRSSTSSTSTATRHDTVNYDLPSPSTKNAKHVLYLSPILPLSIVGPLVHGLTQLRYRLQLVTSTAMTRCLAAKELNYVSDYVYLDKIFGASPAVAQEILKLLTKDNFWDEVDRLGLGKVAEEWWAGLKRQVCGKGKWVEGEKVWVGGSGGWSEGMKYEKLKGKTPRPHVTAHFVTAKPREVSHTTTSCSLSSSSACFTKSLPAALTSP